MNIITTARATFFIIGLLLSGFASAMAEPAPGSLVPGRFIVKLTPEARFSLLKGALGSGESLGPLTTAIFGTGLVGSAKFDRYLLFASRDGTVDANYIRSLLGPNNVEAIEQDRFIEFFDFPTDSLFSQQWYLFNSGQSYVGINRIDGLGNDQQVQKFGTPGMDIRLNQIYAAPPAVSSRVVVAIIDSGVDLLHPELQGRIWRNLDEIPSNGIDDDHNGYVDDTAGYDISGDTLSFFDIRGDNDPTDIFGHGSHLAGIVAARLDDRGIVGVAPEAEIMAVKIRPNATNAVGAAGIIYAVANGANVINISWGTEFESLILREAIDFARANGVFVAISTGNSGSDKRFFPAAFDSAFAVGASDSRGFVTDFSTFGSHIDIVAPGLDILSIRAAGTDMFESVGEPGVRIVGPDSLYYLSDGTSMSAPVVAGAAALILSLRPSLLLNELETILRIGATDIIDPLNNGSNYPGVDSISGFGRLDIASALFLTSQGGAHIVSPVSRNRHTGQLAVQIAGLAGYSSGWQLFLSVGAGNTNWQEIASGATMPQDSIAYQITDYPGSLNGSINLKLVDDFGKQHLVQFLYVSDNKAELLSPLAGEEHRDFVQIRTNCFGPDYDSLQVSFAFGGSEQLIFSSTGEFFDSLTSVWGASGLTPGQYTLILRGFFSSGQIVDSAGIILSSSFALGWPQTLSGRGALSPVVADLDNDGTMELIMGTSFGLHVFHPDGSNVDGFPALPQTDMRCLPAIYDIDGDGFQEIIIVNGEGIWAFNHDGSIVASLDPSIVWPQFNRTGLLSFGYPNPTITQLGSADDSAIVLVNDQGTMLAYTFDGLPYFRSLEGFFTSLNPNPSGSFFFGGNSVAAADLTGDGQREVVLTYSAVGPTGGVGLFEGRTGQPAFDRPASHVIRATVVYGTVLADLNGDNLNEIITTGYDSAGTRNIWVKTLGEVDLPGWPRPLPELDGWRGAYPMVADLDLDGVPEILVTFFEFEISSLYVFRADGSPYLVREGRPLGELYNRSLVFGVPIVANLLGDDHPEIILRSGHILPGTGTEQVHILDFTGSLVDGYPIDTPARPNQVFSTIYAPLVDDLDGDGLVELILVSDALQLLVWDFEASSKGGKNRGRLFMDNLNSSIAPPTDVVTDVDDDDPSGLLPTQFVLAQNYPNPFNPTTTIMLDIPRRTHVTVNVFNILGQNVATLLDREMTAGRYSVRFDGEGLASGIYFYRMVTKESTLTRKMVLLK